jgi:hypothetical protein
VLVPLVSRFTRHCGTEELEVPEILEAAKPSHKYFRLQRMKPLKHESWILLPLPEKKALPVKLHWVDSCSRAKRSMLAAKAWDRKAVVLYSSED